MNLSLIGLELAVVACGLGLLLLDLVTPPGRRRWLGAIAVAVTGVLFLYSLFGQAPGGAGLTAFGGGYVADGLGLYFKRFFLLTAVVVLLISLDYAPRIGAGVTEFYALTLFALAGMMFAASANDFTVLFVAIELITVSFYVLVSFQRARLASLEAGVKYLILGGVSSAFLVYGIALVYGAAGTMNFTELAKNAGTLADQRLFQLGMLLVLGGLAFKVAVFPFQVWAPDVYEGSPAPATAFLSVGSKAAGVAVLVRLLGSVVPDLALKWEKLLMAIAAISILYGSLCAIPQRSLKRLLGYSSIANGGFLLLGLAAMTRAGSAAVLYYLTAYLFTVLAAFAVVSLVLRQTDSDDIAALHGLHRRSPLLAAALAMAMVSLAGVPPLAGFIGKFLLFRAVVEQGAAYRAHWWLIGAAIVGAVIAFYYYFGVIRAIYWPREGLPAPESPPLEVPPLARVTLCVCLAGMLVLGVFPGPVWDAARAAVGALAIP